MAKRIGWIAISLGLVACVPDRTPHIDEDLSDDAGSSIEDLQNPLHGWPCQTETDRPVDGVPDRVVTCEPTPTGLDCAWDEGADGEVDAVGRYTWRADIDELEFEMDRDADGVVDSRSVNRPGQIDYDDDADGVVDRREREFVDGDVQVLEQYDTPGDTPVRTVVTEFDDAGRPSRVAATIGDEIDFIKTFDYPDGVTTVELRDNDGDGRADGRSETVLADDQRLLRRLHEAPPGEVSTETECELTPGQSECTTVQYEPSGAASTYLEVEVLDLEGRRRLIRRDGPGAAFDEVVTYDYGCW